MSQPIGWTSSSGGSGDIMPVLAIVLMLVLIEEFMKTGTEPPLPPLLQICRRHKKTPSQRVRPNRPGRISCAIARGGKNGVDG